MIITDLPVKRYSKLSKTDTIRRRMGQHHPVGLGRLVSDVWVPNFTFGTQCKPLGSIRLIEADCRRGMVDQNLIVLPISSGPCRVSQGLRA